MTRLRAAQFSSFVKEMDVTDLWPLYPTNLNGPEYSSIFYSVIHEGLEFPIVVLKTTVKEWRSMITEGSDLTLINPPPERLPDIAGIYLVMCGNNRLDIACSADYTSIDAIICTNKEEVNKWCGIMRKHWRSEGS